MFIGLDVYWVTAWYEHIIHTNVISKKKKERENKLIFYWFPLWVKEHSISNCYCITNLMNIISMHLHCSRVSMHFNYTHIFLNRLLFNSILSFMTLTADKIFINRNEKKPLIFNNFNLYLLKVKFLKSNVKEKNFDIYFPLL